MPNLTRTQYFFTNLLLFILPFIFGLWAIVAPKPSILGFRLLGALFVLHLIGTIVSIISKLYESRLYRTWYIAILRNISGISPLVALWRISDESILLGIVLLCSHLSLTVSSIQKSDKLNQKKRGPFNMMDWLKVFAILSPIIWIIMVLILAGFAAQTFVCTIIALIGYMLTFYFTSLPKKIKN